MIVGIDLGTTNSLVAVWQDGKAKIIPNALGEMLTPSVVSVEKKGHILVGQAAKERLISHPGDAVEVFKRYMGSNKLLVMGGQNYRSEELSSFVLRALKEDAEAYLGESVTEAVISVPAYFNDIQRKATKTAGELAGLKVDRLINEPTAAAMAYGLHLKGDENKLLVFDLGGGTFDVSILHLFEGVMEVRASAGDNYLGGEDFVEEMVRHFIDKEAEAAGIKKRHIGEAFTRFLRKPAEILKKKLSTNKVASVPFNWKKTEHEWEMSAETFERINEPLLARLRAPVERALRDATLNPASLEHVVLVGGATRMPMIRKLVAKMFGRMPSSNIDPDQAVALGAAIQAGLKANDTALDEIVMTDVCPYTLGIEVVRWNPDGSFSDGMYSPIIERNSVIPISKSETYSTVLDNQSVISVKVFQGESWNTAGNILLDQIELPVRSSPAGKEAIDVRFTYDINGILEVEVTNLADGKKRSLVIEENPGVMPREEIMERLKKLEKIKIHPRNQIENRTILARAERLYEEHLGDTRKQIGAVIGDFEALLAGQNTDAIAAAREQLTRWMNDLENSYLN